MPASPSELVQSLHSTLSATMEHLETLDQAEGKAHSANEKLAAILRDIKTSSARLEQVKAELAKAERDLKEKTDLVDDERARALQEVNRQIEARQQELQELDLRVGKARHEHDSTVERMRQLVERLQV